MATAKINGVRLYYELTGEKGGEPLVFVHGSWDCHATWNRVVPPLASTFRVLTYDRRGHSNSERLPGAGIREHMEDLATLLQELGLVPAWVAGNSFGASIVLWLAGQRPELFHGLIGHEPPLFSLLSNDPPFRSLFQQEKQRLDAVVERIDAGDHAGGAERFVESVALGPRKWAQLPAAVQQMMIENAPAFRDEARDPEQLTFALESITNFSRPALLTLGGQSPPTFQPVVIKLASALARANIHTFRGAGHIPHASHPDAYVRAILTFTRKL